jgi:hypothetical protein
VIVFRGFCVTFFAFVFNWKLASGNRQLFLQLLQQKPFCRFAALSSLAPAAFSSFAKAAVYSLTSAAQVPSQRRFSRFPPSQDVSLAALLVFRACHPGSSLVLLE